MKLKVTNKISSRVQKRFKWMSLAAISVFTLQYMIDMGFHHVQEFQFVEAGADASYESDDLYNKYIESAKFQTNLLASERRNNRQTWTLNHYRAFQARRLQTILATDGLLQQMSTEQVGEDQWYQNVPNNDFDNLPEYPQSPEGKYSFKGAEYENYIVQINAQGYVEEFYGEDQCFSSMINNQGVQLLPKPLMGFMYLLFLGYLFLGISISADIFMEAIEVITSKTELTEIYDPESQTTYQVEGPVWNATMANLTLMAFGSSAPEIILSMLEAYKGLGEPSGELGPSTIVGSAAFNLLVISAVSVYSVGGADGEVKHVNDMGVFVTTGVFSIFAYVWLYLCLVVNTKGEVTVTEASWTLSYFVILLVLAFCADKYNQNKMKKAESADRKVKDQLKMKKAQLRSIAKAKGEAPVLNAAQGIKHSSLSDNEINQIKELYKEILEVNDLSSIPLDTLMEQLKSDSLFERFAYRKAVKIGATKDFMDVKGQKFQIENMPAVMPKEMNNKIGFKVTHYSVSEASGTVSITIEKKQKGQDMVFGVRTIQTEQGAKSGRDFDPVDEIIQMAGGDDQKVISIKIHDNQDWQPDLDFHVEIYDQNTGNKLWGDNTTCRITILDEDFPGTLGFELTEIQANRGQDRVDIVIKRMDGSDGTISCIIKTEAITQEESDSKAKEFEDYLPKNSERIVFTNGEVEKIVQVYLVDEAVAQPNKEENTGINPDDNDDEEDEGSSKLFKVIIESPEPAGLKISKKNACVVEIKEDSKSTSAKIEHTNMINFFVAQKNPSWSEQFKNAVKLQPCIDEDNNFDDVTLFEALFHFATIGWKVLFACIPPCEWGGGKPAFIVALAMIGGITAIVAEVATVLGCTVNLKPAVTAITLVAVGTSLPDTFASMTAAQQSQYADSAIGNVTGSNSVNVFVGLGLPWLMSAIYQSNRGEPYITPPGNLAFSVMLFLICSITCFIVLGARRATLGGELGGTNPVKGISAMFLVSLWIIYVSFSSLKAYGMFDE